MGLLVLVLGYASCEPVREAGIASNQFLIATSDGRAQFYLGSQVRAEVEKTGRFVPSPEKRFSLIDIPIGYLDKAIPKDPFTVSLCDGNNDVRLFDNIPLRPEEAEAIVPTGNFQDPHISFTLRTMTATYRAGDPGVYGALQVAVSGATVAASANASLLIPFDNGQRKNGALLFGFVLPDSNPDDPLLLEGKCSAPDVH